MSDMAVLSFKGRMHDPFRRLVHGGDRSVNHCSEMAPLMDSLTENIITLSQPHNSS